MDEIDRIVENAIKKLNNLEGFDKIKFIILYGSAVNGIIREESDIDLCIDIDAETDYERSICMRLQIPL